MINYNPYQFGGFLPDNAPQLSGAQKIAGYLQGAESQAQSAIALNHLSKLAGAAPAIYGQAYANVLGGVADPSRDLNRQVKEAQLFALTNPYADPSKQLDLQIQQAKLGGVQAQQQQDQSIRNIWSGNPTGINPSAPAIQMNTPEAAVQNFYRQKYGDNATLGETVISDNGAPPPIQMMPLPQGNPNQNIDMSIDGQQMQLPPLGDNYAQVAQITPEQRTDVRSGVPISAPILQNASLNPMDAPVSAPPISPQAGFVPNPLIPQLQAAAQIDPEKWAPALAQAETADLTRQAQFEKEQYDRVQDVEKKISDEQKAVSEKKKTLVEGEKSLRGEFEGLPDVKEFRTVESAYGRIKKAAKNPSAAGDIALLTNYMKMLDPGSTVREGEFATAQNAGSVPTQIQAQYNKVVSGERLTPDQRSDFLNQAEGQYNGSKELFDDRANRYKGLSEDYGFNPDNIVQGARGTGDQKQLKVTVRKNLGGKNYVQSDGKWYEE